MLQSLSCTYTIRWLLFQHRLEQLHFFPLQLLITWTTQVEVHLLVVLVNLVVFCALKQWLFHQKYVEYYSCWKNIALRLHMNVFCQWNYLRSHISRRPASVKKVLINICMCRQTKIYNHRVHWFLVSQHYVFRLQVPVHYPVLMHVSQTFQKPLHESFYLDLWKIPFILKLLSNLPSESCGKAGPPIKPTLRHKLNSMIRTHSQVLKCSDGSCLSWLSIHSQDFPFHFLQQKCFVWKMLLLQIFWGL